MKMIKVLSALLSFILFLSCFVGCENKVNHNQNINLQDLVFNRDIVELSQLDDVLKIDSITSGLDSYSFDTVLYDLKSNKKLCEVSFDEGSWVTGQTINGFYVFDAEQYKLCVYDRSGLCTKTLNISKENNNSYCCALSEDEKLFAIQNYEGSKITFINISDNTETASDIEEPLREILSFADQTVRAVGMSGAVYEIKPNDNESRLAICALQISEYTEDFCFGRTESNFMLVSDERTYYVPVNTVDEVFVGTTDSGFVTEVSNSGKSLLRVYDVKQNTISRCLISQPVEKICYTDSGILLALVGYATDKKHKIVTCVLEDSSELEVYDKENHNEPEFVPQSPNRGQISKDAVLIKNVPIIAQYPEYPTGCESVSTVMALRYAGEYISVESFITNYLPMSMDFYNNGGKIYGPSPYEYFIGNPKTTASYGCMAPVIAKALQRYYGNDDMFQNVTGNELSYLCEHYIDNNIPVITWVTIDMRETVPRNSWHFSDGTRFTWLGNEHCMLLIGYDSEYYYFNDPYVGELVKYPKELTETCFAEYGKQAIVVLSEART